MKHFTINTDDRRHAYNWARNRWNDTVGEAFVNFLSELDEDEQDRIYIEGYTVILDRFEAGLATVLEANGCDHNWVEQEGEPPCDVCNSCGAVRY